jgi:hypothetical protein
LTILKEELMSRVVEMAGMMILTVALLGGTPLGEAAAERVEPLRVNLEELVEMAVIGEVAPARQANPPYRVSPDGELFVLPGTGSITYNFRVGDSAVRLAGDHVEPAVSLRHPAGGDSVENRALNVLACVGNSARVISGEAKGAEGIVIGKHGGVEHVMVEFPDEVYEQLAIGDKIQIRATGQGMRAVNFSGIKIMNMSPRLLEALTSRGMGINEAGRLRVPVTHTVPSKIMGSGLGQSHTYSGDYDIQMFDASVVAEYGLETLRFGDIVAILDADSSYGRVYRKGAVTIGVVAHGFSNVAGHGPGVTTLIASPTGNIDPIIDEDANLAVWLDLR